MVPQNSLITNFLQNIFLCVQNKHIHTGLDLQTRFQKSWDTVQIVNKNNAMMWKFQISIFYSEYNIDDISNV